MTKNLLTTLFMLLAISLAFSQNTTSFKKNLIGKWYPEKYKETDGKSYAATEDEAKEYIWFKSDGTMESLEYDGKIMGKWSIDTSKMILIATQSQSEDYPSKMSSKIITLTETQLVLQSLDEYNDGITLYFRRGE